MNAQASLWWSIKRKAFSISYKFIFLLVASCLGLSSTAQPCPATTPTINASGNLTFCYGDSVALSVIDTFQSYEWLAFISPNTANSYQNVSTITINYTAEVVLQVTDSNNCQYTTTVDVATFPYVLPAIQSSNGSDFCSSSSVNSTLYLNALYTSYLWNTNSTASFITITDTGNYAITVTDSYNCTFTSLQQISYLPNRKLGIGSISGNLNQCAGDTFTVILRPIFIDSSECALINWSDGTQSYYDTVHTGGAYSVTIIDTNGCEATSDSFYITIVDTSLTINQFNDTLKTYPTVNAQWYLNDTAIPGAISAYYIPLISGNYRASYTGGWLNCTYNSQNFNFIVSSSNTLKEKEYISVFPNPASDWFRIELPTIVKEEMLNIYNITGQRILAKSIDDSIRIDVNSWPSGIYFYSTEINGHKQTGKIVVQH